MRVLAVKNSDVEGLGSLEGNLAQRGYDIDYLNIYNGEKVDSIGDYDVVVVLGAPFSVFDSLPFLPYEFSLIEEAIEKDKLLLGICFGCQAIAHVLGAKVYKGRFGSEIGWYDMFPQEDLERVFNYESIRVFEWHSDTFDLPENSVRLGVTARYRNQAFRYKRKVIGLQFHLELTKSDLENWLGVYESELKEMDIASLLSGDKDWHDLNENCGKFLDYFLSLNQS